MLRSRRKSGEYNSKTKFNESKFLKETDVAKDEKIQVRLKMVPFRVLIKTFL